MLILISSTIISAVIFYLLGHKYRELKHKHLLIWSCFINDLDLEKENKHQIRIEGYLFDTTNLTWKQIKFQTIKLKIIIKEKE
jgi:hypothetical protein